MPYCCPLCNGPCEAKPTPDQIVAAVCEQHWIDVVVLRSRCRKAQLVSARRDAAVA